MTRLLPAIAAAAALAFAAPAWAQTYMPMAQPGPSYYSVMGDDGSSSDYPVHMPSDVSGDYLNRQVLGVNRALAPMAPSYMYMPR